MRIRDARQTFVGWWIRLVLEGKQFQIFGDGKQMRDLNYVDDVVDAMLLAGGNPQAEGRLYNIGAEPLNLLELAELLVEAKGDAGFACVPFPEERKAIDTGSSFCDYSRIGRELGWRPKVGMRDGLSRTLDYDRSNIEHYL